MAATFFPDGFTTTCAPTLAAEGRPKSKATPVASAWGLTVAAGFVVVPPGSVGTPAVGLGVAGGSGVAVGVVVGKAGAVISAGVAVGVGFGVAVGVGSGVIVGVTSTTADGSGSFCLFALQDTANTMIPIISNRHKPPVIRSLVRLSSCSIFVVLSTVIKKKCFPVFLK